MYNECNSCLHRFILENNRDVDAKLRGRRDVGGKWGCEAENICCKAKF